MTLDVVLSLVAEAVAVAEATGVLDEVLGHTSGKKNKQTANLNVNKIENIYYLVLLNVV